MVQQTDDIAAILYTDLVGYAHASDPERTVSIAYDNQTRQLVETLTQQHGGHWLQALGDSAVCTFDSAVRAMQCAMEIQQRMADECDIRPRIGIHVGDVVFHANDVGTNAFFDAVNVAARVQALAESGGICISGRAHEELSAHHSMLDFDDLGEVTLEDVDAPVRVHRIKLPDTSEESREDVPAAFSEPSHPRPGQRDSRVPLISIAVLLAIALAIAVGWWFTASETTEPVADDGDAGVEVANETAEESGAEVATGDAAESSPGAVEESEAGSETDLEVSQQELELAAFGAVRDRLRNLPRRSTPPAAGRNDFSARVWTIPDPVKDNAVYHIGIEADCSCNALLFSIDGSSDAISLLFPNPFHTDGTIRGGQVQKIPSADEWILRAVGGEGIDEIVLIVADSALEFGGGDEVWSATPEQTGRVAELDQLLEKIGTLAWDSAAAPLQIVR